MDKQTLCRMWLQQIVGQGATVVNRLFTRFQTLEGIYEGTRSDYVYAGVPDSLLDAFCNKDLTAVAELADRAVQQGGWILTQDSPEYPEPLKHLYSPPLVLYGKGVLPSFEQMPVIGIVGTRKCTAYGVEAAGGIAAGLAAAGCPIVSGGAVGIDRAAHEGAMFGGGVTIAVQACGLDVEYPVPNQEMREAILATGGALISEYPPGTHTDASFFQVRNRLISGLSWGVCVVEAPHRSGALITVRTARDQGKDIFAVPGNITSFASMGSNELIRDGVYPVLSPADILQEYQSRCGGLLNEEDAITAQQAFYHRNKQFRTSAWITADAPLSIQDQEKEKSQTGSLNPLPETVSAVCRKVYDALSEVPMSAEMLYAKTGLSLGEIFSALTELEIYGSVKNHPGQNYSR